VVGIADLNRHDAPSIFIGKRVQQHVLDDAENGGYRADAQREREDREQREDLVFAQAAQAEAQILYEPLHESKDAEMSQEFRAIRGSVTGFNPIPDGSGVGTDRYGGGRRALIRANAHLAAPFARFPTG